tara:strand:+ start:800 stop:1000 length:201 start_codon:yes stop_codon:yes gene_type:complete
MQRAVLQRAIYFILIVAGAVIVRTATGISVFTVFLITLGTILLGRIAFVLMTHSYDDQPDDESNAS